MSLSVCHWLTSEQNNLALKVTGTALCIFVPFMCVDSHQEVSLRGERLMVYKPYNAETWGSLKEILVDVSGVCIWLLS